MHKHVYLGLSILEISKIAIYKFWYDNEKAKLCCMDIDSFIFYV